jgi:hypothetical protein
MTARLARAIEGTREAEVDLLHELRKVADRHLADHDVQAMCSTLAERTQRRIDVLEEQLGRYGRNADPVDWEGWDHVVAGLRRAASKAVARHPEAGVVLVDDLRTVYLAAEEVLLDWTLLKQGAMAVRDKTLLDAVKNQLPEVDRVGRWAKTRIKVAAPQVLAG